MIFLARTIHMVFGLYSLGLIVYIILGYVVAPWAPRIRTLLEKFYLPLLDPIRTHIKPINIGNALVDISPMILLVALILLRSLLLSLLVPGF